MMMDAKKNQKKSDYGTRVGWERERFGSRSLVALHKIKCTQNWSHTQPTNVNYGAIFPRSSFPNQAELAVRIPPTSPASMRDTHGASIPVNRVESRSLKMNSFCMDVIRLWPVHTMKPTDKPTGKTQDGCRQIPMMSPARIRLHQGKNRVKNHVKAIK